MEVEDEPALVAVGDPGGLQIDAEHRGALIGQGERGNVLGLPVEPSREVIRQVALHQALLSYPLGVVIIASMINLVSNLAK